MILYEEVSLDVYFWLFGKKDILFNYIVIFLHPKVKRRSTMFYISSHFKYSENSYKEVTTSISEYEGQSKAARTTMKIRY